MPERILFAGGGTGGHVYMAVAIRDWLRTHRTGAVEALFVGTPTGLENHILPPLGFPLETIRIGGLQGMSWRRKLSSLAQLPGSLWAADRIVRRFQPELAVGLGGYSSGPVVLAASWRGIPRLLIEPNATPGLANRWLARFSQGAAVAFPETTRWFRGEVRVTGIPIREEFHRIDTPVFTDGILDLLVFGGSRGSHPINQLLCGALPRLRGLPLRAVHQTGPDDRTAVQQAYREHRIEAEVLDYIEDMPHRFEQADLIVARAGASTIAEITAAGRPALLIPYPQAADNHQLKNARALERRDAALVLEQPSSTPEDLARTILELAADRDRLQAMGRAAKALARPQSAAGIVQLMDEITGGDP